jgi:hypothetical protein
MRDQLGAAPPYLVVKFAPLFQSLGVSLLPGLFVFLCLAADGPPKPSGYCNPVGLVTPPMGEIVPPAPLLVKRLFVLELTVPDTPVLLNERSLLDRLTDPPVRLIPIPLKVTVVASTLIPPPEIAYSEAIVANPE